MTRKKLHGHTIADYYSRFGSWAGYNIVLGRSQHAGYWTSETKTEKQAQNNYKEKLANILSLQLGDKVLDAGSGQGYLARYLVETTGAGIIGMTITKREVKVSNKLSRNMTNKPTFVLGDYSVTTFPDSHFDVIYTTETLVHNDDIQKVINEFYRILKPGGRIYLFDYEVDTTDISKYRAIFDFLINHAGFFGLYSLNPGVVSSAMSTSGFIDIKETDWTKQTKPSFDRFRKLASPLKWIKPDSKLAPYFVNTIMANYGYSNWYEDDKFRYLVYEGRKSHGRTTEK